MKRLWIFIVLCFGFSWAIAAWVWSLGGLSVPAAKILIIIYMAGPAFAAVICALLFNKGRRIEALGLKPVFNRWLIFAWFAAILFILGSLGISILVPGIELQNPALALAETLKASGAPEASLAILQAPFAPWLIILQAAVIGALINSIILLSEELGWRGWLWDHLSEMTFWRKNLLIGLIWGIWHAPIIMMGHNYPGLPVIGTLLFIGFCILISPVMGYLRERNGSVWSASVFHGTVNATAGVALLTQSSADMPWRGSLGIGGFIILILMSLWVWARRRKAAP